MDKGLVKLTDADKAVDFTKVIQGHVGNSVKQVFTIKRTRARICRPLKIEALEHIVEDQFGNLYVVFLARLYDGEVYACTAWVGSYRWNGQGRVLHLVKEFKRFPSFNDDLLACIQNLAFISFGNTNVAILKARHAANQLAVSSESN